MKIDWSLAVLAALFSVLVSCQAVILGELGFDLAVVSPEPSIDAPAPDPQPPRLTLPTTAPPIPEAVPCSESATSNDATTPAHTARLVTPPTLPDDACPLEQAHRAQARC